MKNARDENQGDSKTARGSAELLPLLVGGASGYTLFTMDADGLVDSWNAGAAAVFGWLESEILGQHFQIMFTPEDRALDQPRRELETAERDGYAPDVRWHLRKDGGRVFINGSTQPILDGAGGVSGFLKIGRDQTAQRTVETALEVSEAKYRALFDTSEQGFVFGQAFANSHGQADFRTQAINAAGERIVGQPSDILIARTLRDLFPSLGEQWWLSLAEVTARGPSIQFEEYTHAFGRWLSVLVSTLGPGHQGGVVLTLTDITQRRMAEHERLLREKETALLSERQRMAQELHDTFAQGFTGIRLQIDMAEFALNDEPPNLSEAAKHFLRAREFAQKCQQEARQSISALRPPSLEDLSLKEALEQLAREASSQNPVVFTAIGTPLATPSWQVQNDIYRVAQEALTNALRHGTPTEISLTLSYLDDEIQLSVVDNGQGFDNSRASTGFGMTGMRERAQRIGAVLKISSELGKGTRVTLALRVARPPGS